MAIEIVNVVVGGIVTCFSGYLTYRIAHLDRMGKETNRKLDDIIKRYEKEITIEDDIKMLHDIKDYFLMDYTDIKWEHAAFSRANFFIDAVDHILRNYEMGIKDLKAIINYFSGIRAYVSERMIEFLGIEEAEKLLKKRDKTHKVYEFQIEQILTDTQDSHRQRFVYASADVLKCFLKEMKR